MEFVDLGELHRSIEPELTAAIREVIENSSFIRGPHVEAFESGFAELIGVDRCISCANGTDALYIAMKAMGIGPGDEVITTAHSWIATSETITQTGAKVVFVDTEDGFFTIDPAKIEAHVTSSTKAIIPVHLYGQPADMNPIMAIAKRHNLFVIEDCAQAHLSKYKERIVGTIGDMATFSFYPGKNLGAMGDAGAIVTNNSDLADFCELFARHGGKNNHFMEGINSRMDGLQAAILNVKMKYLEGWTRQREQVATWYDQVLPASIKKPCRRVDSRHVFHLYVVRLANRDAVRRYLNENGVPTAINYPKALPDYPAYDYLNLDASEFGIAKRDAGEILSIPMHPLLSREEVDRVSTVLGEALNI